MLQKMNCAKIDLQGCLLFLTGLLLHSGPVQAVLHVTTPEAWFRGCQLLVKNHSLSSQPWLSSLMWFKKLCKISFLPHSLTLLSTTFFLMHLPSSRFSSTPCLFLAQGLCASHSLCPAFPPFLIFLWLFLACYSVLSLHDTSSEKHSMTTKLKVPTS